MIRLLSLLLCLGMCLGLTACSSSDGSSSGQVVSASGDVVFSSSASAADGRPAPESPPAVGEGSVPEASLSSTPDSSAPQEQQRIEVDEVRAVWVSYLELERLLTGKSETAYREGMAKVMQSSADFGLNTVILQVRPFADAIYPSDYFPQSYLFTGEEGNVGEAPFDALHIALEEAHGRGLRLEAWVNPYRIRNKAGKALSDSNMANELLRSGDAVRMGDVMTYDPSSARAQQHIVDGVVELVKLYPELDGIHFDDYFYPTTDAAFDAAQYGQYKSDGGKKSLAAWRRENVTTLVHKVSKAIKASNKNVTFGISPQGNMSNNLDLQFVDVEELIQKELIDYVCPQMYFGFQNAACPYQSTIEDFNRMAEGTSVQVYVGLATYKFNKTDSWAGPGKNEWIGTTNILGRQVESARALSQYGGFVLYRYDSTFAPEVFYTADATAQTQTQTEMSNLKKLL